MRASINVRLQRRVSLFEKKRKCLRRVSYYEEGAAAAARDGDNELERSVSPF